MTNLYESLRAKVRDMESDPKMTLTKILNALRKDKEVPWKELQVAEKKAAGENWKAVVSSWKFNLVQRLATPGLFKNGGDHCSARWRARGKQHGALVTCVEKTVHQTPPDVTESALIQACLDNVQEKWRPVDASKGTIVRETVRIIAVATRRRSLEEGFTEEEQTILEAFNETKIVEYRGQKEESSSEPFNPIPAFLRPFLCAIDLQNPHNLSGVLALVRDISKEREETERLRIQAETERLRIEKEPECKKQEAEILRREALKLQQERLLLLAQRSPAPKRKLDELTAEDTTAPCVLSLGRMPRLPPNSHDLVRTLLLDEHGAPRQEIVSADAPPLTLTEYAWLAETLDERFVVHHRETWSVLWARRPRRRDVIPTYLDLNQDPIVPRLRTYLAQCLACHRRTQPLPPPPVYPASDAVDPRPVEEVPDVLRAVDPEVWDRIAAHGVDRVLQKLAAAYRNAGCVAAATAPCDERLRQWRRLRVERGLTFATIADALGWTGRGVVHGDATLVQLLTHCVLRSSGDGVPMPVGTWYQRRGSEHLWLHEVCLGAMRTAVIFVSRVRLGGGDLRFVAQDLRRFLEDRMML